MKLSTIIEQARGGELKGLSTRDKDNSSIIHYINLGLTALYTRFNIKMDEFIVALEDGITNYPLYGNPKVTKSSIGGIPVGLDTDEVMLIVTAYDESGRVLAINNEKDPSSIFTPSYNEVQIPNSKTGEYISCVYKVNPKFIDVDADVNSEIVDIPLPLLEPLLHYIGYRAHGSVNGEINAENNTHYMRFEASCKRVEDLGVLNSDDVSTYSVRDKGFI